MYWTLIIWMCVTFEAEIHMVPCNSSVTKVWRNLYWYKDGKIYCHQSIFCDCQKPFSVGLWLWGRPLVNSTSSLAPSLFPILLQVQCKTPTFSRILVYSVSQCSLTWVVVQNFSRVQVFEARTCAAAHKHPAERTDCSRTISCHLYVSSGFTCLHAGN